jgi:hypothetical protein
MEKVCRKNCPHVSQDEIAFLTVWRATWALWKVSNKKSHQFRWGLLKIFAIEKKEPLL